MKKKLLIATGLLFIAFTGLPMRECTYTHSSDWSWNGGNIMECQTTTNSCSSNSITICVTLTEALGLE